MATGGSQDKLNIFVPINKIDEEARLVYGTVAAEVMDNSGEMFDYEGSKEYFDKWSQNAFETSGGKSYGNVRVMHTTKVAGIVASPLGFDDDNKVIEACAKVIDDAEWEMVKAGGYTGFSMGGRYVSRATKSDGIKSYVADPCEISLVDKPCIPTAVFSVVKADGLAETRRFRDDLYQKADTMPAPVTAYVPTNDEMLPVARDLAKAAGKTENDWLDFMDAARDDLIAKNTIADGNQQVSDIPVDDPNAPAQADGGSAVVEQLEDGLGKGDNPFADGKKKDDKSGDDAKDGEGDDAKSGDDGKDDAKAEKDKDAKKADLPELSQGWRAADGSFHLKKADALAHNETLAVPAAEPTAADRIAAMIEKADKVAAGEAIAEEPAVEATATTVDDVLAVIVEPMGKFAAFRDSDTLAKSLYNVERLASIMESLDYLHCSLTLWGDTNADNHSPVAGEVLDHIKGLGETLVAMATAEVKDLVERGGKRAGVDITYDDGIVELASSTLGLEKGAFADTLQKRAPQGDEELLAKVTTLETTTADAVAKAAKAEEELSKVTPMLAELEKRFDAFLKTPMPKAPTTAISKGAEPDAIVTGDKQIDLSKFTPDQLADAAIRMAHSNPTHIGVQAPR